MPDRQHEPPETHEEERGGRFRRLGRRLFGEGEERGGEREGREGEGGKGEGKGEGRREGEGRHEGKPEGRSIRLDARDVFGALWEGGDRAKTEVVRAVAREVRTYIEELGLKEDLRNLLTNYSFEIKASVHLRRLAPEEQGAPGRERKEGGATGG